MVRKVRVFGFVFLLLSAIVLSGCGSLFYWPRVKDVQFYDPKQVGLEQENVRFTDEDGRSIHGWWFATNTKPAKGTFIFFHGNAENITTHFLTLSWLPGAGYNYFIFDYPGYGLSDESPSPRSTTRAGVAAIKWVHDNKDKGPLILYGQSLGGIIGFRSFLETRDQIPFRAVILDSTFLSYKGIARAKAGENWITWIFQPFVWLMTGDKYAPQHIENRAPVPLLVMHGDQDKVIPPAFGQKIFDESPEPKELWILPGGRHGDSFWGHEKKYRAKVLEWLETHR